MFGFDCFDWTRQLAPLLFAIPDLDCFAASVILSACCCDCSTGAPEVRLTHPFGHPIDHLCVASVSSLQLHGVPAGPISGVVLVADQGSVAGCAHIVF